MKAMDRPGSRPYKAVIYLPGHDEHGHLVTVRVVTAGSQEGLEKAVQRWLDPRPRKRRL